MFPRGKNPFASSDLSLGARCDAMLLGKLGNELAHIYSDTLSSPLPSGLKSLIDRLESATEGAEQNEHAAVTLRDPAWR